MEHDSFFRDIRLNYTKNLHLPNDFSFFDGSKTIPVLPILPTQLKTNSIMIIGAYPTAIFNTIQGKRNVPVGNIDEPFALGTKSGKELEEYYLKPLRIKREDCWITNLLKVFLFKTGHVNSYKAVGSPYLPPALHSQYQGLAGSDANLTMFEQELKLASPKLIITLGADVAGILHPAIPKNNRNNLLKGEIDEITCKGSTFQSVHFVHPGIMMRRQQKNNPWPQRHSTEHIPKAQNYLNNFLYD